MNHSIVNANPMQMKRNILRLAWPAILRLFLQSVVGVVDIIMVGQIGSSAIASVDMGNRLVFVLVGALMALSIGSTTLVAHYVGAGKKEQAQQIMWQSLLGSILLAVTLAGIGVIFARYLMRFLLLMMETADPFILDAGVTYLRIVFISMVFALPTMVINAVFQGLGDMKAPLIIMTITNVCNVVFNYLLIFGIGFFPELGVTGAGLGTSIGRVVGLVVGVAILLKGRSGMKLVLRKLSWKIDIPTIKDILKIGIPASIEQFVRQSSQILYTILIAGLGTASIAANAVTMNIASLAFMPGFGFGVSATTLVGQSLGAKKHDLAYRYGKQSMMLTVLLMSFASVVMVIWTIPITRLFSDDPEVLALAFQALRIFVFYQPFFGVFMVLAGALRGAGDTKWVMYATMLGNWAFRLVFTLVFLFWLDLGLRGIWLAMGIDVVMRSALIANRFRSGKWKHIEVMRNVPDMKKPLSSKATG